MNRILSYVKENKQKLKNESTRVFAVVFFTIVYGIGMAWFLEASVVPLYSGGIPGFGQLFRDIFYVLFEVDLGTAFIGLFVLIVNIPILLLGWFKISHRFTVYSIISVLIQAFILSLLPRVNMGLDSVEHALAASVLGGLLIGIGAGGALRFGTSTGGFDILAQYFAFKKGKSVGMTTMSLNLMIALLGGMVLGGQVGPGGKVVAGGLIISYTVIRIIITTIAVDRVHTSYHFLAVDIITETPNDLSEAILHKVYRGVTLLKAEGAYSHHEKTIIYVIISAYELHGLIQICKEVDPKAFIVTQPVRNVTGNFRKKTIT